MFGIAIHDHLATSLDTRPPFGCMSLRSPPWPDNGHAKTNTAPPSGPPQPAPHRSGSHTPAEPRGVAMACRLLVFERT